MRSGILLALILSLGLAACSKSDKDDNKGKDRQDFASKPLSPGQLENFEQLIQSVGRFEHSFLGTATADELLIRMQSAVRAACVSTGAYGRPENSSQLGSDGKPRRQVFSLNGAHCPVYANLSLSQSKNTPTYWFGGGDWTIADADLAKANGVRKITVRVQKSDIRKTSATTSVNQLQDVWVYGQDGDLIATIRVTSRYNLGGAGMTGTRSLEVFAANGDRLVEMKTAGSGPAAEYFINGDRIAAEIYESYLSALGPLASGTGNEAG